MPNSPPNRKRNKTLTIRLTPEEWTKLMEGTLHAGMNVTEYLLSLSDSAQIFPPPDLSPVLAQLKRIGNNLNQIARYLNEGGQMNETLSQEIRKTLTTLDLSIHDFNSAVEAEYGQSS